MSNSIQSLGINNYLHLAYETACSIFPKPNLTTNKVKTLALIAFGVLALSNTPTAKAGPVVEVACMAACTAAAFTPWGAIWWSTCMEACSLLGFAPTP